MIVAESGVAHRLRRALLLVAVLAIVGTLLDLAMERHWKSPVQLIPWATLALSAVGVLALLAHPTAAVARWVRRGALAVFAAALFGIWEHVEANYSSGPLDARYERTWQDLSEAGRWLRAITKSVGPSPVLAPGALAIAALCVLLATIGLRREQDERGLDAGQS